MRNWISSIFQLGGGANAGNDGSVGDRLVTSEVKPAGKQGMSSSRGTLTSSGKLIMEWPTGVAIGSCRGIPKSISTSTESSMEHDLSISIPSSIDLSVNSKQQNQQHCTFDGRRQRANSEPDMLEMSDMLAAGPPGTEKQRKKKLPSFRRRRSSSKGCGRSKSPTGASSRRASSDSIDDATARSLPDLLDLEEMLREAENSSEGERKEKPQQPPSRQKHGPRAQMEELARRRVAQRPRGQKQQRSQSIGSRSACSMPMPLDCSDKAMVTHLLDDSDKAVVTQIELASSREEKIKQGQTKRGRGSRLMHSLRLPSSKSLPDMLDCCPEPTQIEVATKAAHPQPTDQRRPDKASSSRVGKLTKVDKASSSAHNLSDNSLSTATMTASTDGSDRANVPALALPGDGKLDASMCHRSTPSARRNSQDSRQLAPLRLRESGLSSSRSLPDAFDLLEAPEDPKATKQRQMQQRKNASASSRSQRASYQADPNQVRGNSGGVSSSSSARSLPDVLDILKLHQKAQKKPPPEEQQQMRKSSSRRARGVSSSSSARSLPDVFDMLELHQETKQQPQRQHKPSSRSNRTVNQADSKPRKRDQLDVSDHNGSLPDVLDFYDMKETKDQQRQRQEPSSSRHRSASRRGSSQSIDTLDESIHSWYDQKASGPVSSSRSARRNETGTNQDSSGHSMKTEAVRQSRRNSGSLHMISKTQQDELLQEWPTERNKSYPSTIIHERAVPTKKSSEGSNAQDGGSLKLRQSVVSLPGLLDEFLEPSGNEEGHQQEGSSRKHQRRHSSSSTQMIMGTCEPFESYYQPVRMRSSRRRSSNQSMASCERSEARSRSSADNAVRSRRSTRSRSRGARAASRKKMSVGFAAELERIHVYTYPSCVKTSDLFYSREDDDTFSDATITHARAVRSYIKSSIKQDSTFNSLTGLPAPHVLKKHLLAPEDIIGVEHLLCGSGIAKASLALKVNHSRALMDVQRKSRGADGTGVVDLDELSSKLQVYSDISAKLAQCRASYAAMF